MNRPTNEVLGRLAFLANTRGIIPDPIDATRVDAYCTSKANQVYVVYTVPAGKRLFIDSLWLCHENDSNAMQDVDLYIRSASDVYLLSLCWLPTATLQAANHSQTICPAQEVNELEDICVKSYNAASYVSAGIHGWLESV